MDLIKRFFPMQQQSFFLFGPRGTGKSTLMHTTYPHALSIDLLDPQLLRSLSARPESLSDIIAGNSTVGVVIIDEIQKVPALLSVVHALIEKNKKITYILTGSSARKIKRAGVDLLAGRALLKQLHPFMAAELGEHFSLEHALTFGLIPVVFGAADIKQSLQAYVGLYIKEEVQAEGLVRSLENFSRFLEVISYSHAATLNVTNIARECEVKRKTVENYIDILEDLLLAFKLPMFTKRAQRSLSVHPKFYFFDAGVFRTLRPKGMLDRSEEIDGAALEGLVVQHLRAWNDYSIEKHELAFWRTRSGVEVDVIVYGPLGFWAIEVKNATKVHSQDTKPLETFLQDYPMAQGILLYRGKQRLVQNNVLCIPCEEFLLHLQPNNPLI